MNCWLIYILITVIRSNHHLNPKRDR